MWHREPGGMWAIWQGRVREGQSRPQRHQSAGYIQAGPGWAPAYLSSLGQHNNPGSSPVRILISCMQKLRQREGSSLPRATREKMAELGFGPRKVDYWAVLETSP